MKYLGIDFGAKRIGLAVSDAAGRIAFPRGTVNNDESLSDTLASFISSETIESIVIGNTRTVEGAENPVTARAEIFAHSLQEESGLPVEMVFEGWSSIEASRYAPDQQGHDDAAAAAIILQRYLDIKNGSVD